ncbi:MAG: L-threonylcarbamoyladenylate synthase [Spirochaetaceae bacterium]|nr:L-threonylcarbamoyladenylate synthase [Spirochaetaceae bacterium]
MLNVTQLDEAAAIIKDGGLVAFPTETVYGLGANALNDEACKAIYAAKGRPSDNPFIIHLYNVDEVAKVAKLNKAAEKLLASFAPGPLTLVLPKIAGVVCSIATAGLDSVAVRVPSHPVAQKLLQLAELPIAAPSANLSGRLSATTFEMVKEQLDGKIAAIIQDDSKIEWGLESTVVSLLNPNEPILLRSGAISLEELEEALSQKITLGEELKEETPRSPGQKYAHYRPPVPLYLIKEQYFNFDYLVKLYGREKLGLLCLVKPPPSLPAGWNVSSFDNFNDYASNLYKELARFSQNCVKIVAVLPSRQLLGRALNDRLLKAAAGNFVPLIKEE